MADATRTGDRLTDSPSTGWTATEVGSGAGTGSGTDAGDEPPTVPPDGTTIVTSGSASPAPSGSPAGTSSGSSDQPTRDADKPARRFGRRTPRGGSNHTEAAGGTADPSGRPGRGSRLVAGGKKVKAGADAARVRVASLVWLTALLGAMVLAGGALLFALDANMDNWLVAHVIDLANKIDGPFANVFEFHQDHKGPGPGPHDHVKEHLVNWGLAAVAYLVAGRVLDRIIRP